MGHITDKSTERVCVCLCARARVIIKVLVWHPLNRDYSLVLYIHGNYNLKLY